MIAFGMDMEAFLDSQVGRYLDARAKIEIKDLREQFDDVDPNDAPKIGLLQLEIAARKIWKDWLIRAVQEGVAQQDIAIERGVL